LNSIASESETEVVQGIVRIKLANLEKENLSQFQTKTIDICGINIINITSIIHIPIGLIIPGILIPMSIFQNILLLLLLYIYCKTETRTLEPRKPSSAINRRNRRNHTQNVFFSTYNQY
jgi:hypothetical protein